VVRMAAAVPSLTSQTRWRVNFALKVRLTLK
jgi:hypothetical protein